MAKKRATKAAAKSSTTAKSRKKPAKKKTPTKKRATKKQPARRTTKKKRGNSNQRSVINELQAALDDSAVLKLYMQGIATSLIAQRLGKPVRTVQNSIKRIRGRFREENLDNYEQAVEQCTAMFRYVRSLALQAYEESRGPEVVVTVSTNEEGRQTETRQDRTPATGDARFLAVAERCTYQIGQIHGLFDRDARNNSANLDQVHGIVEIVVSSRGEAAAVQRMTFEEAQHVICEDNGAQLLAAET